MLARKLCDSSPIRKACKIISFAIQLVLDNSFCYILSFSEPLLIINLRVDIYGNSLKAEFCQTIHAPICNF